MKRTDAELRTTAYHEAGHAVADVLLRLPLKSVDVVPVPGIRLGFTASHPFRALHELGAWGDLRGVSIAAGKAAEAEVEGCDIEDAWCVCREESIDGDVADLERLSLIREPIWRVYRKRRRGESTPETWQFHRRCEAVDLVRGAWPAIEAVAAALLTETELQSWRVRAIVRDTFGGRAPRFANRRRLRRWPHLWRGVRGVSLTAGRTA